MAHPEQGHSPAATQQRGIIRRLLSFIWGSITWLRVALLNVIFLLILVAVFAGLTPQETVQIPDDTALRLSPSGFLVDQYSYNDPLTQVLEQSSQEKAETRVQDLVIALQRAKQDPRITSLVLELNYLLGGGLSKLEEVGAALQDFRTSGKSIIAISDSYSQDQYYLASFADDIYLNPMGAVLVTGYSSYRNYFKDALDKLSLNYHVFRAGTYKDAVEPFLQNEMSDVSREHNRLWLNDLWRTYMERVEVTRHLDAGTLNDYINNIDVHMTRLKGDTAQLALELNLVDQLASQSEIRAQLSERFGRDEDDNYLALDYWDYLDLTDAEQPKYQDKVGLLVASGIILDGEQPEGNIGSETFSQLIRDARKNPDIKALVVRIDSGGGSAFASEVIRQEMQATRDQGIPVVVSMGSVAASGGYWMAMASDEVWATPTTITGSIGVFSAFPTMEKSLTKLGVHTDGLGTTELAGALRLDRELSPLAKNILQQGVNHVYQQFLTLVADARQSTPAQINQVAQGRVWTGNAALQLGLVDELGGLNDAIAAAAKLAELSDYEVFEVRRTLSPGEQFAQELAREFNARVQINTPNVQWLSQLNQLFAPLLQTATGSQKAWFDARAIQSHCVECVAP